MHSHDEPCGYPCCTGPSFEVKRDLISRDGAGGCARRTLYNLVPYLFQSQNLMKEYKQPTCALLSLHNPGPVARAASKRTARRAKG